ncbi:unnamed protein product [Brassica oleracea]
MRLGYTAEPTIWTAKRGNYGISKGNASPSSLDDRLEHIHQPKESNRW